MPFLYLEVQSKGVLGNVYIQYIFFFFTVVCLLVKYIGAAYCCAELEITKFIEKFNLPFLPTPMGKGVISDEHPQCVAAARSR